MVEQVVVEEEVEHIHINEKSNSMLNEVIAVITANTDEWDQKLNKQGV